MRTKVRVDITKLDNDFRRQRAQKAASDLEIIINSKEFRDLILSMPNKWRKGSTGPFKNKSNQEIYNAIMGAKETFWTKKKDNVLDLFVDDYYRPWSKVVGYIIPGKKTIFVNTKFFDSNSILKICSNFLHEAFHHLGMLHGGNDFRSSIPYYANYCVEKLYPKLITQDIIYPEYQTVCRGWWIFKRCYRIKV